MGSRIRFRSIDLMGSLLCVFAIGCSCTAYSSNVNGEQIENNQPMVSAGHSGMDHRSFRIPKSDQLRGRKMGALGSHEQEEKDHDGVVQVKRYSVGTVANSSVGKCEHDEKEEGELNLECEMSRSLPSSTVRMAGHVPFTSDYHAPKTHPPKNN